MDGYAYGLWPLVVVDSALVIGFAVSFFHPAGKRDWRTLGMFAAFMVALFAEMYGYPLTIYLLSGAFGNALGLDLSHNDGHLWNDLIGWNGDPHLSPFHLLSYLAIIAGFWMTSAGWRVLFQAQRNGELATTGLYARMRHPQYDGLLLVMAGFLLQWPTIPTLVMFPVLVWTYRRLALREERDAAAAFGERWDEYARQTPRFIPRRSNGSEVRETTEVPT